MSREQLRNKEKAEECLHIRLTPEEKDFLWKKAKERGVNLSTYVKQKIFSDENQILYNTQVSQQINHITDILVNHIELHSNDKEFIYECKRSFLYNSNIRNSEKEG